MIRKSNENTHFHFLHSWILLDEKMMIEENNAENKSLKINYGKIFIR